MDSLFYVFLGWNLFLAVVPYVVSQTILFKFHGMTHKLILCGAWGIWLVLLPNAPYLITDLIHLHNAYSNWLWFDLFMVFVFASNGVFLFVLSVSDFLVFLKTYMLNTWKHPILLLICFLSGYGIYMGRFLRFNSWDLITKPTTLFAQMGLSLAHLNTWLMSIAFGMFLWISFSLFQWIKNPGEID